MAINGNGEFYMRLFNGHCWQLVASSDTSRFLEEWARIMRLETAKYDHYDRLFFIQCDPNSPDLEEHIPDTLPKKGWKIRKMRHISLLYHKEVADIICDIGTLSGRYKEYPSMICSLTPIIEHVIKARGTPLHSALIVRDGYGVLLMARPRVGKSTCCQRLPTPWKAWCDDFTLVIPDEHGNYHAQPLPTKKELFIGNKDITWDVQAHVPLKAIFLLEQSQRDEVIPIDRVHATSSIYNSALRGCYNIILEEGYIVNSNNRCLTFNNACDISKKIPSFKLRASIDGKYWEEIDRVLQVI